MIVTRGVRRYTIVAGIVGDGTHMLRTLFAIFALLGAWAAPAAAQEPERSECLAMANAPLRATPVSLRVVVNGKIGSGRLLARPPRRTFWQWLTRRRPSWTAALH